MCAGNPRLMELVRQAMGRQILRCRILGGPWSTIARLGCVIWLSVLGVGTTWSQVQEVRIESRRELSGKILAKTNHSLSVLGSDGESYDVLFQDVGVRAITLSGGVGGVNAQTEIKASGNVPISLLRPGMALEVKLAVAQEGEVGPVSAWRLLPTDSDDLQLEFIGASSQSKVDFRDAVARGVVVKLDRGKVYLRVPKSEWAPRGGLVIPATSEDRLAVEDATMREVRVGDQIQKMEIFKFSTGDWVARSITVELSAQRDSIQSDPEQQYELKYRDLSPEPEAPREVRSRNFVLKTDLSPRSAQILLDKLETMFSIVGKYYNRRSLSQPIYCYVAEDLDRWGAGIQELAEGLESIRGKAGVTVAVRLGNLRRATVYSCGDHSVVQHEAVHAFCHLGFGGVGPTWYAEGMAELGCYWRPGDVGVNIDPIVIRYLTTTRPMPLVEVVRPGQTTGDSWQAYAWRWALCYMMVNNPNYSQRFYRLGDLIMRPNTQVSFYSEFADVAAEVSFEYDQFVRHMGNGYQQELCSWDWKTKVNPVAGDRWRKCDVEARRGWQASGVKVEAGQSYEVMTQGQWAVGSGETVSPNGDETGRGRLVAAVLVRVEGQGETPPKYELSAEIPLGEQIRFNAPVTGHLVLRCQEALTQIGDNEGEIKVAIRNAP